MNRPPLSYQCCGVKRHQVTSMRKANQWPVRPMPHITSSRISRAPWRSQAASTSNVEDAQGGYETMVSMMGTVMGGAQPVAASIDHEAWHEVVGTIAGDDTVLIICPDPRRAGEVETRIRTMLES